MIEQDNCLLAKNRRLAERVAELEREKAQLRDSLSFIKHAAKESWVQCEAQMALEWGTAAPTGASAEVE